MYNATVFQGILQPIKIGNSPIDISLLPPNTGQEGKRRQQITIPASCKCHLTIPASFIYHLTFSRPDLSVTHILMQNHKCTLKYYSGQFMFPI